MGAEGIVVVGAGQAAASLVAKLRGLGCDAAITLIGEEPVPPYQRPPLSKAYLLGEMEQERLFLRPAAWYRDMNITLRLGMRAVAIDPGQKQLRLQDGTSLSFGALVLATGSTANRLPAALGGDLRGVHVVRDLADVDHMAPAFKPGRRVVIIGGGYIGLEAAAVAAKRGLDVCVVEQSARILQRVAAPQTSDFFRALHRGHGVRVIEGVGVHKISECDGQVSDVQLADGRVLPADFVIVGVGIKPATALAEAAGLAVENGILVDEFGRCSNPDIWAVGDCAAFPHAGGQLRLESVPHAIAHGECVAANLMGAMVAYRAQPWFWSDQYDVKLQIAGLNTGYDKIVTRISATVADASVLPQTPVSFWYYRDDQLLAVDAMNDPRAFMIAKRLIEAGRSAPANAVADSSIDLKTLLG